MKLLSILDVAIILTFLWNILRGLTKGFVEEVVSVIGIAIAIFFSINLSHPLSVFINAPGYIGVVASGLGVYLVFFIVFKVIAYKVNAVVSRTRLGIVNRVLGFLFGVLRGILLCAMLVFFVGVLVPNSWIVKTSKLGIYVVPVANVFSAWVPHKHPAGKAIRNNWSISKRNFAHSSK